MFYNLPPFWCDAQVAQKYVVAGESSAILAALSRLLLAAICVLRHDIDHSLKEHIRRGSSMLRQTVSPPTASSYCISYVTKDKTNGHLPSITGRIRAFLVASPVELADI